jgi:hypothetical protein
MNEKEIEKIAVALSEIWGGLESIASRLSQGELIRELNSAEALFKFAIDVLRSKRILDCAKLSVHRRNDGEVAIEATFDGIHLHTEFVSPNTEISDIIRRFNDNPEVALKAAITTLVWALSHTAQTLNEWHVKHFRR